MPEISLEGLKKAMMRCAECKLDRHGCARNEAHATGRGCKGFTDTTGIEVLELRRTPSELHYRLAVRCDRDTIEVVVRKEREPGVAVWDAALVRMGAHSSVPWRCAGLYGQVLARASRIAEYLDGQLD